MVADLESRLRGSRQQFESVVQNYESAIEELQVTREQVHAVNEELESATHELHTEREQLRQSLDDSMDRYDALAGRLEEIEAAEEELSCLLDILEIPILVFGSDLALRYFSPAASKLWNIHEYDIGRSAEHFVSIVRTIEITALCAQAAEDLTPRVVQTIDCMGRPGSLIFRPFAGRKNRAIRIAVILLSPEFEIAEKFAASPVLDILESALPRMQAALGGDAQVEVLPGINPSLKAIADPGLFEDVLVRSALAARQTVMGPARVTIAGRAVDPGEWRGGADSGISPGDYVAISIAAGPSAPAKARAGRRPRGMQVPEMAIGELGAFYKVEYTSGLESKLTLYLARATGAV